MDALLQAEVSLQGPKRLHEASAADKASWVGVRRALGGLTTDVNESAVRQWLDGVVAAEERDPINAIDEVDANGTLLEPARPGKVGADNSAGQADRFNLEDITALSRIDFITPNLLEARHLLDYEPDDEALLDFYRRSGVGLVLKGGHAGESVVTH